MSIHQTIFDTLHLSDEEVMALIGAGDIESVKRRRETMLRYLSSFEWDEQVYKLWLRENPPPMPSIGTRVSNVTKAFFRAAVEGMPIESKKVAESRLAICESNECGLFDGSICRHSKCGCFAQIKKFFATEHCPEGKW